MEKPKFMTSAEAARLLNVTPETVRCLERTKKLPALRTESGVRLFHRADVESLVAKRNSRRAD